MSLENRWGVKVLKEVCRSLFLIVLLRFGECSAEFFPRLYSLVAVAASELTSRGAGVFLTMAMIPHFLSRATKCRCTCETLLLRMPSAQKKWREAVEWGRMLSLSS